ncbi:MAG: SDR family NAD(P)-dependent oxidoreductase, partial [Rhodospirillales bacterium]|nr:SDR family NAD(P)-dependent oxidoreductase [Rhodospirillales bacterium]
AADGVTLALSGRDRQRLEAVATACRDAGARVNADTIDVTERAAMTGWVTAADDTAPLGLVVANAAISAQTRGAGDDGEQVRDIFAVNVAGVLNTVLPVIPGMRRRRRGQIALMSSIAGFRGLPGAPAYSASKAAVKVYGEALRGRLAADGISVSVVCPGYVRSRMTADNDFPMPFLMDAEPAAAIIKRGLGRSKARICFPLPMHWAAWLLGALPPSWTDPLLSRIPRKE